MTVKERAQAWLNHVLSISERPDPLRFFMAQAYFRAYRLILRTCYLKSTSTRKPLTPQHYDLFRKLAPQFYFQLTEDEAFIFDCKFQAWVLNLFLIKEKSRICDDEENCWRNTEDFLDKASNSEPVLRCMGSKATVTLYVSIPITLIVESPHSDAWDFPDKITILRKGGKYNAPSAAYRLVSRVFRDGSIHDSGAETGRHYISRHIFGASQSKQPKVFSYDDIKDKGMGILLPDSKPSTHLAGKDSNLVPPIPSGYRTSTVVYHLEGGRATQEAVYRVQLKKIQDLYNISCSTPALSNAYNAEFTLTGNNIYPVTEANRPWYSPSAKNRRKVGDYDIRQAVQPPPANPAIKARSTTDSPLPIESEDSSSKPSVRAFPIIFRTFWLSHTLGYTVLS